jgi:hypothetical protein
MPIQAIPRGRAAGRTKDRAVRVLGVRNETTAIDSLLSSEIRCRILARQKETRSIRSCLSCAAPDQSMRPGRAA